MIKYKLSNAENGEILGQFSTRRGIRPGGKR